MIWPRRCGCGAGIAPRRNATLAPLPADTDRVVLEDGATIHIRPGKDFLVIATGSVSAPPCRWAGLTTEAISKEQSEAAAKIAAASNIVIVGGGPVGVELAGEIRDRFATKRVTIVHRGPFLCSGKAGADKGETVPKAFGDELKAVCEARSIAVRVGTRVDAGADADPSAGFTVPSGPVTLSDGSTLGDVDLVVWATGSRPNNAALVGSMDDKLDAAGRVKVAESLLVPGTDNVFAIGDCAESHGPKTAYHGRMQADLVAKSIAALAGGAATDSLGTFSAGGAAMLVPIGSTAGRAYLPFCGGLTIGDGKVSSIKGKDLFTAQTHKEMGTPE